MSDRPNDWVVPDEGQSLEDPYDTEDEQSAESTSGSPSTPPGHASPPETSGPPGSSSGPAERSNPSSSGLGEGFDEFAQSSQKDGTGSGADAETGPDYSAYEDFDDMDMDASSGSSDLSTYFFVGIAVLWVFLSVCSEMC